MKCRICSPAKGCNVYFKVKTVGSNIFLILVIVLSEQSGFRHCRAEFQFVVLPLGPDEGIISFNTDYSKCPLFKMDHDLLSNSQKIWHC